MMEVKTISVQTSTTTKADPKKYKNGFDYEGNRKKRSYEISSLRKQKRRKKILKKRLHLLPLSSFENDMLKDGVSVKDLVSSLKNGNKRDQILKSTKKIRLLLAKQGGQTVKTYEEVVKYSAIPRLVLFLTAEDSPELQLEAAWCLTNICCFDRGGYHVVKAGGIGILVTLLKSDDEQLVEQAAWTLGNIITESEGYRDEVVKLGAARQLCKVATKSTTPSVVQTTVWCMINLWADFINPPNWKQVSVCIEAFEILIRYKDPEIIRNVLYALEKVTSEEENFKTIVSNKTIILMLIDFLSQEDPHILYSALKSIGNIASQTPSSCVDKLLEFGLMDKLPQLLAHKKKMVRQEAVWITSNITAGTPKQLQHVRKANILPTLIDFMKNEGMKIRHEAAWALSNFTIYGTPSQTKHLVKQGVIPPLVDLLDIDDAGVQGVVLDAIKKILEVGEQDMNDHLLKENPHVDYLDKVNGIEIIEGLQYHASQEIALKSRAVLQICGTQEEYDDDYNLMKNTDDDNVVFQMYEDYGPQNNVYNAIAIETSMDGEIQIDQNLHYGMNSVEFSSNIGNSSKSGLD